MSHSPEPWRIRYYEEPWVPEAFGTHDIVDANGNVVSAEYHPNEQQDRSVEAAPERLKRIVACVNALAGFPTDKLTPNVLQTLLSSVKHFLTDASATAPWDGEKWVVLLRRLNESYGRATGIWKEENEEKTP